MVFRKGEKMKKLFLIIALSLNFLLIAQAQAASCKVILENSRGRVLDSFRGYGYDRQEACRDANRECRRAIRAGYYRDRQLNCRFVRPERAPRRTPRRDYNRNQCVGVNVFGKWAQGGGCNTFGCWYAGGGCNTFGCWYSGGSCNTFGCLSEAPKTRQACQN